MNNFELIDDYLANRLEGQDKDAFERQLTNDPSLKSDVELQRQIVDGIRRARATELKTMLNKVPLGTGIQIDFSVARIAASVVTVGVVAAALYYYFKPGDMPPMDSASADLSKKSEQVKSAPDSAAEIQEIAPERAKTEEVAPPLNNEAKKTPAKKDEIIKPAEKPKLDVTDPSDELNEQEKDAKGETALTKKPEVSMANIDVELDSSSKKYDFHYQFSGNKLVLYGSFDKSLYEVLEINGDSHAIFLFYKDGYYLIDETQNKITKLTPIKDGALLRKLKEYRNR